MFWKVELLKDGSISTVEPCARKGRNGSSIIYVEAPTREGACIVAKEWHSAWAKRGKNHKADAAVAKAAGGPCRKCVTNLPMFVGGKFCRQCLEERALERAERKAGRLAEGKTKQRWVYLPIRQVLDRFDNMSGEEFRRWLVDELDKRMGNSAQDVPQAAE